MIKANHKHWADFVFNFYIKRLLKKSFKDIYLQGEIENYTSRLPLFVVPNHSTWWDGFFVYILNEELLKRKFYILMLEDQLRKYHFFQKLGAFSIDQDNPKKIIETFKYIQEVINIESKPLLFTYFPQGVLQPNHIRPLNFKRGINRVIKASKRRLQIMPLSMKVLLLNDQKPEVFIRIHPIQILSSGNEIDIRSLENQITSGLDQIDRDILLGKFGKKIDF